MHLFSVFQVTLTFSFWQESRDRFSLITLLLNHFLHYILQGYLQNFHLVTGQNSHTHQCPHADQDSPTPAQFKILEQKFDQLLALLEVVQQEVKLRGFSQ